MDERGVSPVIGVILMVDTIVIAAVVMGMLGGFSPPKRTYSISVTATQEGDDIIVTYNGGPDQDLVSTLIFSGTKSNGDEITWDNDQHGASGWVAASDTINSPEVGNYVIATN